MKIIRNLLILIFIFFIAPNGYSQEKLEDYIYNNDYLFNEQNLIWIDDEYYTTQISCINISKESENNIKLEFFKNNKIYTHKAKIAPQKGYVIVLDKLDDFLKAKKSQKFGVIKFWYSYETRCSTSYISKNNDANLTFTLNKDDEQTKKSYLLYKSDFSHYKDIKQITVRIYNTSDNTISGKITRFSKNGENVVSNEFSLDKFKRKSIDYGSLRGQNFLLEVDVDSNANFICFLDVLYNNGVKQILKPSKVFSNSSLLEAKGSAVFTNVSESLEEVSYQIYKNSILKLKDTIKIDSKYIKKLDLDNIVHLLNLEEELQNLSDSKLEELMEVVSKKLEIKYDELSDLVDYIWKQENSTKYNNFINILGEFLDTNNDDKKDYVVRFLTKDDDSEILGYIEDTIKSNDYYLKSINYISDISDRPLTISSNPENEILIFNNSDEVLTMSFQLNDKNLDIKIGANDFKRLKTDGLITKTSDNEVSYLDKFSLINKSYAGTSEPSLEFCRVEVDGGVTAVVFVFSLTPAAAVAGVIDSIYMTVCASIQFYYYETDALVNKFKCPTGYFPESCLDPSSCDYIVSNKLSGYEIRIYYQCVQKCTPENIKEGGHACGDGCCYNGITCAYDSNSHVHHCSCKTVAPWYSYLVGYAIDNSTGNLISRLYTTDKVVEMFDTNTGMIGCCPLGKNFRNGKCEECESGVICEGECCDVGEGCITEYVWSYLQRQDVAINKCGKCKEHHHWNKIKGKCVCDGDYALRNPPSECGEESCRQDEIYNPETRKCECKNGNVRCPDSSPDNRSGNAEQRGNCCDDGQVCVEHNNSHICTSCNKYEEYNSSLRECLCKRGNYDWEYRGGFMCGLRCCLANQHCDFNEQCVTCKKNEYFDENKKICVCKNESVCGTKCCESNQYCDSTSNACVTCDVKCGNVCCKNGEYCNSNNVCASCDEDEYFLKSQNMCVCLTNNEPKCNGLCCDENMSCNTGKECECKAELKCGDECCQNGEYCNSENKCAQICDSSEPVSCGTTCCSSNSICENGICNEISCEPGKVFVNNAVSTFADNKKENSSNDVTSCGECKCIIQCGKRNGEDVCCKADEHCVKTNNGIEKCLSCPQGQVIKDGECTNRPCGSDSIRCGDICCGANQFCNRENECQDCTDGTKMDYSNNKCIDNKGEHCCYGEIGRIGSDLCKYEYTCKPSPEDQYCCVTLDINKSTNGAKEDVFSCETSAKEFEVCGI